MAAAAPLVKVNGIRLALTLCGATNNQRDAIVEEGFTSMEDLLIMEDKEVESMMTNITRLRANQGGVRIGAVLTKKVKALVYWANKQQRQGSDLDAN
jgi:hypothetical protein